MKHLPARGFALLYIVLVLSSTLTALVLAAGLSGSFAGGRLRLADQGAQVRVLASDCGERVMMLLRTTSSLTASNATMPMSTGTCTYSITGSLPTKTITLTARLGTLYKRITIVTSKFEPTITATWLENP